MKIKGNILFKEEQRFRVVWLWWVIILCMLSCTGLTVGLALADRMRTKDAMIALLVVVPFEALIAYAMYIAKLETVVSTDGLFYKWSPFQRSYSFIPATEIETAQLRGSPPMNYGCNRVPGYGRTHTTGPGKGLQFVLRNGRKIFFGTNKRIAFEQAVDKLFNIRKGM